MRTWFIRGCQVILGFRSIFQRYIALFLCTLVTTNVAMPALAVYAAAVSSSSTMKQDYAGPLVTPGSGLDAGSLAATPSVGDVTQSPVAPPKPAAGEVTSLRTATSATVRNADGTLTTTQSMQPINYQKNGSWQKIDTSLVQDSDPTDAGNFVGQTWNRITTPWADPASNFVVKDNSWQARFSPSDSPNGMVRIKQGSGQIGFVPLNAKTVAPVITTDSQGAQLVRYYDLWPGVNVTYSVSSTQLKEFIELKSNTATSSLQFQLVGASLSSNANGGFDIKGVFGDQFGITSLNLMLNQQGPVTDTSVFGQTYRNGVLTVSVDKNYLKSLPASAFPAVIDPGVDTTSGITGGGNYKANKSDGTSCGFNTNPQCKVYVGGLMSGGLGYNWRSEYYAPYTRFQNNNYRLVVANMNFHMQTGPGWHGTTNNRTVWVYNSVCNNAYNCVDWNKFGGSSSVGTDGVINITGLYQQAIANGNFGMWVAAVGDETSSYDSFKEFDPLYTTMSFTWGDAPPAPSIITPSASGQVFTDPQVAFRLGAVSNPNNSVPLQYEIQVSSASSGTGTLIDSGLISGVLWTIPDGMLQDGSTYYIHARSYDSTGSGYGNWSSSVSFKIDMRTGNDNTQTYDTLGPVKVDLATGNVSTSNTSHTSSALGGNLGVSLNYNSPVRTRTGLRAQYWNNTTMSGSPVVDRVDQNIDFDWWQNSPSASINTDNFSAKWTGYFVAPKSGSYYFGGNHDDSMTVIINGQTVYSNSICASSVCYGASSFSYTAGQVLPIEVDYVEYSGNAFAKLWAKGAVAEGAMPSDWFRTDPRPVTQTQGLVGHYYFDDGTHNLDSSSKVMFMQRTDPVISYLWDVGSPVAGGPTDNFMVRWNGYFTAPTAGNYTFGAQSDDGVKITVGTGNTVVLNAWQDQGASDRWASGGYSLFAGQTVPITIDYYEHTGGATMVFKVKGAVSEQVVPSAWLSTAPSILPAGWQLGLDADGNLSYDHAKINQNSVVLTDSSGDTHEYTYQNGGYKPPVNEDGQMIRNSDGTITLQDIDGRTYVFNTDGTLKSVTSPVDDRNPAALQYAYASPLSGGPAQLTQITDGVTSSRWAKVYYAGDSNCGSIPSGYDATPANMLCAVATNDGRTTYFYYKNGFLARVAKPGNDYTDYDYDTSGRIISIRDSLANDAVAAGVRTNDVTVTSQLTYDVLGRAISVTQPAANAGDSRIQNMIEYLPGDTTAGYTGATQEHVTGATEPNGFSRRVEYDSLFRTTRDIDIANLATTQVWDSAKDLLLSSTDPTDMMSTTIYDDEDRPISSYGPAPSAWFGSDRKPTSTYVSQVPHVDSTYDQGISGPSVAWYNTRLVTTSAGTSPTFYGAPKLHTTGILPTDPTWMGRNFATNPAPISVDSGNDNIGFSATGKIVFPGTGIYTFKYWHDDGARLFVDGSSLFPDADWTHVGESQIVSTGTFSAVAGKVYQFRFDFANRNAQYQSEAWLAGPGITDISGSGLGTNHWGTYVRPDYNLTTSTTTYDATVGNSQISTNYGSTPELGLAQSASVDPSGLNLTTSSTYEAQGTGFLRQLSSTLPGGAATNYTYYSATDTKDNPCTQTVESYNQAGRLRIRTEPDPDGAGAQVSRTSEIIYDEAGNAVASRYNQDAWTCTTYDARGRVTQQVVPTINSRPGRTVTTNYAYLGSPLQVQTVDSVAGTTVAQVDLLGRSVSATDTFGNVSTTTYDSLGRLATKTSPVGTETYAYDSYNRPTTYSVGGTTYATISYDSYSRVQGIVYNQAKDASNNTLKLEQIKRDALQRTAGATYRFSNNLAFDETVTLTQSGMVSGVSDAYNGTTATSAYNYDKAGRLTQATVDKNQYAYGYQAPSGSTCNQSSANLNAQKDSNRTSFTLTDLTTNQVTSSATYCYNQADQLIASSDAQIGTPTYDDHGNTVSLAGNGTAVTFGYDASDSNISIIQGANQVTYVKAASGAVLRKKEYQSSTLTASYRYLASGAVMQTCSLTDDNNCTTADTYLSLPGGVTLTLAPTNPIQAKRIVYSIKNFHGDTAMTIGSDGNPTSSVYLYEPFGQASPSVTFATASNPANSTNQSMGWAANPTRKVEGAFTVAIIQMGARVYLPSLGRFLQVDPVPGGTANAYVYVGDPVNGNDYSGKFGLGDIFHAVQSAVVKLVSAVASRVTPTVAKSAAKPAAQLSSKSSSPGSSLPLSNGKVDFQHLNNDFYKAHPPTPQKPFDLYAAGNGAYGWSSGGALVGGAFGCAVGGVAGGITGALTSEDGSGIGLAASVGCVGAGQQGAVWGGGLGGVIGWHLGGTHSPGADAWDWLPNELYLPWTKR